MAIFARIFGDFSAGSDILALINHMTVGEKSDVREPQRKYMFAYMRSGKRRISLFAALYDFWYNNQLENQAASGIFALLNRRKKLAVVAAAISASETCLISASRRAV